MGATEAAAEPDTPTVEDWSEKDQRIVVRTTPGTKVLADLVLRAKVSASPDEVYAVLTYPDSHVIFRGIKATLERRTLEDDGKGRRKLLVCHQAMTRFLWLHVTFSTQLLIEEDDKARTISFRNARDGGFMRTFTGRWEVLPFNQETLNHIYSPEQVKQQRSGWGWLHPAKAIGALQHRLCDAVGSHSAQESSLVTLEQMIGPRVMPPGPLMRMVRGMCARTVINMMEDLHKEIDKRRTADGVSKGPKEGGRGAAGSSSSGGNSSQHAKSQTPAGVTGHQGGVQPPYHHAACMTTGALDLFSCASPMHITVFL